MYNPRLTELIEMLEAADEELARLRQLPLTLEARRKIMRGGSLRTLLWVVMFRYGLMMCQGQREKHFLDCIENKITEL